MDKGGYLSTFNFFPRMKHEAKIILCDSYELQWFYGKNSINSLKRSLGGE